MTNIIYRKNKMFCIDESKLALRARKTDIITGLYAAIYTEFSGAVNNPDYSNLDNLQKLEKVNQFVNTWLEKRGLL